MAGNSSHALVAASGVGMQKSFNRPLVIARSALEAGAALVELGGGAALTGTGIGAIAGAGLVLHGGLTASAAIVKLVASVATSAEDYERVEAQLNVVSGVGVFVLLGEGLHSALTNTPVDLGRAASISEFGNAAFDGASFFTKSEKATGAYSVAKNLLFGYSKLNSGYNTIAVLGSGSPPVENQYSVGKGVFRSGGIGTAAPQRERVGPEAHDSRIEREIRENGGTPRVDNTDRIREQQERQREMPGDSGGSGRAYYG